MSRQYHYHHDLETYAVGTFKRLSAKCSQKKRQPDQLHYFNLPGSYFAQVSGAQKPVDEKKRDNKYSDHYPFGEVHIYIFVLR